MESERVMYANEGKGKQAVQAIGRHLQAKEARAEQIQQVSMELSPAFIAGVKATFPGAQIPFDRFHIVKLLNQAVDAMRKAERKEHDALKGHQYTFIENPQSLSETQQQQLASMLRLYPTLGEATASKYCSISYGACQRNPAPMLFSRSSARKSSKPAFRFPDFCSHDHFLLEWDDSTLLNPV
jgi:hypothetical protein